MGAAFAAFSESYFWGVVDVILVLVGTNRYSFSRLVKAIDRYAKDTGEEIFIQLGHTDYIPEKAAYERFLDRAHIEEKIGQADVIVTQGGFGSIADCLIAGKRIVAVPRKPELNEAPDRQEELVRELEKLGCVIAVYDIEDLPSAINRAREMRPAASSSHRIPAIINDFIRKNS